MAGTDEIKSWIRKVHKGKPLTDESILIQKDSRNFTRIVLLDQACCAPVLTIDKRPGEVSKEDIESREHLINHRH